MRASDLIFGFGRDMLLAAFVLSLVLHLFVSANSARLSVGIGFLLPAAYLAIGPGPALWSVRPPVVMVLYLAGALLALIAAFGGAAAGMALRKRFRPDV